MNSYGNSHIFTCHWRMWVLKVEVCILICGRSVCVCVCVCVLSVSFHVLLLDEPLPFKPTETSHPPPHCSLTVSIIITETSRFGFPVLNTRLLHQGLFIFYCGYFSARVLILGDLKTLKDPMSPLFSFSSELKCSEGDISPTEAVCRSMCRVNVRGFRGGAAADNVAEPNLWRPWASKCRPSLFTICGSVL